MDLTSLFVIGIGLMLTAGTLKVVQNIRRNAKADAIAETKARIKSRAEERAFADTIPEKELDETGLHFTESVEVTDVTDLYELNDEQRAIIDTVMSNNGRKEIECKPAALRRGDTSWSNTAFSDDLDPWGGYK